MYEADCHEVVIDEGKETLPLQPVLSSKLNQDYRRPASPRLRSHSVLDIIQKPLHIPRQDAAEYIEPDSPDSQPDWSIYKSSTITCRRSERRARRLNTLLLQAIRNKNDKEVEKLLKLGAHPDSTCNLDLVSACHIAAICGGNALSLLIKFGAKKIRIDRLGRTPLHLAAWAGNCRQVAVLLDFPEDLTARLEDTITKVDERDIRKLSKDIKDMVNVRCQTNNAHSIPKAWLDNIDHECKILAQTLPSLCPDWTPLHAASSCARNQCTKLLLLAGADPNCRDIIGRTPLDVVGSYLYNGFDINTEHFTEVIKQFVAIEDYTCSYTPRKNYDTPLHIAVELESLEAIRVLLEAGVPLKRLNRMGLTPLHLCVKKKLNDHLQLLANYNYDPNIQPVNLRDKDGNNILHSAVMERWTPGVCISLETGADLLAKTNEGETAIHLATELGDIGILNDLLNATRLLHAVDYPNKRRETPLFKAIIHGHLDCVKKLINDGASITKWLPSGVNVFHVAAELGHKNILCVLLNHDYSLTRSMINFTTSNNKKGYGPIHYAVANNHRGCVKLLLSNNAFVSLRTKFGVRSQLTPLHIAAENNYLDIAKILVKFDKTTVHNVDDMGWSPLHTACHNRSRETIKYLVQEGADLSLMTEAPIKLRKTALDIIFNNLSKPTEFLEDIFDLYINCNHFKNQDPECEVTVDYNVLLPKKEQVKQMRVIEAILETGNRYDQRRLLLHPLLESFLYLKWKVLTPFFYTIMILYGFFVTSVTVFIVSTFFYKDTNEEVPQWLNANIWKSIVYLALFFIIFQEILYINLTRRIFFQLDTWIKFGSVSLAIIVPYAIEASPDMDWPRHIATLALLFAWLELTFLISRFPGCGYYVLMFRKVSSNVIKIILTFGFLVIGFSLSFMVQFHSTAPFENPWAALVKTMVMMTSEFDYDDLVSKNLPTSLIVVRITFLTFLVLAAIVLMNLMVGVAVNDLHNLEVLGNIRRLEKQVEFLSSLETLVFNSFLEKILPKRLKEKFGNSVRVSEKITLRPNNPSHSYYKILPPHIRDGLFDKIQTKQLNLDNEHSLKRIKSKLNDIHKDVLNVKPKFVNKETTKDENISPASISPNKIEDIDLDIRTLKNEIKSHIFETKSSIEVINAKIDMILNKLDYKK